MAQTIAHLQRLNSYGVSFHSYSEPHLATEQRTSRNILLALLSSLAKVEAQKISERTKAGMARARANGSKIGRPRIPIEIRHQNSPACCEGRDGILHCQGAWYRADVRQRNMRAETTKRLVSESGAVIETPVGTMQGSYQMMGDDGQQFDAPIAPFRLAMPGVLH